MLVLAWDFGIIACYYGHSYSVMAPLEFVSLRNWKRLEGYATNKLGVIPLFLSEGTLLCARSRK